MSISGPLLRDLHRLHRQISDLTERLERGPKQIKSAQAGLRGFEADHQRAKDAHRAARMAADERQLQLRQRENRLSDLQTKLNMASSNREYQLLKDQIAADKQANNVLSDEILEALEQLDALQAKIVEAEHNVGKAQEELERVKKRVEEQTVLIEGDLRRVRVELADVEARLPGDFKSDYNRIIKARGAEALAPVDNDSCGGCYTNITPNMVTELFMGKPVFCKSCGRLLYEKEDRGR